MERIVYRLYKLICYYYYYFKTIFSSSLHMNYYDLVIMVHVSLIHSLNHKFSISLL